MKCKFCGVTCKANAYAPYCGYRHFQMVQWLRDLEKESDEILAEIWGLLRYGAVSKGLKQ